MAAVTGQRGRKIPLSVSELHTGHAEREIILLIDGNGYKPGALAWLKQAVASQDAKLIHVFNLVEFLVWANRRLRQK